MTAEGCMDILSSSNEQKTGRSVLAPWIDTTRSEDIAMLVDALSKAQAKITAPERNRSVKVETRAGGTYSFKYATLDHIIEKIRGPLTENGLWFTQIMKDDQGTYILDTRLLHSSGQWIACQMPLIWDGNGGNQQFGSALTFMRRYALTSLLGIAAEEDDDANAADGNQMTDRKPNAPKPDVMSDTATTQPKKLTVPVPLHPLSGDWALFGRALITYVKDSKDYKEAEQWISHNQDIMDAMKTAAPKMWTNLTTSLTKVMDDKGAQ